MICEIINQKNNITKLAEHEKEIIKQTISAYDSINLVQKVNTTSFGFSFEAWIIAALLAGFFAGLLF